MVYGFMADLALVQRATRVETQPSLTTLGYFTEQMANYFLNPGQIRDVRPTRLAVPGPTSNILGMMFHFDVDEAGVDFNNITVDDELDQFFNICELLYMSQGATEEALEAILVGAPATYGIYNAESLEISESVTTGKIETTGGVLNAQEIRQWVSFEATFTTLGNVAFKLWVDQDAFTADYPICNITKVVFPCDPAKLLAPSDASIVHAVSSASDYVADLLAPEVQNRDHTGVVGSEQAYHYSVYTGEATVGMTFQVYYKGMTPSSSECKAAIIAAIEAYIAEGIEGSNGDLADWQDLFPNLWVTNEWYLIPLWDNTYTLEDLTVIFSGISSYSAYVTKMLELYPARLEAEVISHIELLKATTCELLIAALPSLTNLVLTLKDVTLGHASYQHSPANGDIMSADTQSMATLLERALAKIQGTTEDTTGLTYETLSGHNYWSFSVGSVMFHVLDNEEEA